MNGIVKKAGLGIALAATALTTAVPADAQRWGGYRGHHRGGDTAGAAILGGIVGLGVGAAIASSNRPRYDRGYYGGGYGYNGGGYYDRNYYPQRGYYQQRSYYDDYRPRCWIERRYDPYNGYPINVRVCN